MAALVCGIKEDVLMALEVALVDKENIFDIMELPLLKDVITLCQNHSARCTSATSRAYESGCNST